jgi:hypothetical protein
VLKLALLGINANGEFAVKPSLTSGLSVACSEILALTEIATLSAKHRQYFSVV